MMTIKAPNEQGKIIECALLNMHGYQLGTGCVALFEDLNDYGAVYDYDADRNRFTRYRTFQQPL